MKNATHGAQIVAAARIDTPIGPMTALATARGLAALRFDRCDPGDRGIDGVAADPEHPAIAAARRWLHAYWAGADTGAIEVPLDLRATSFQRAVWTQLQRIPSGQTRSYAQVAAAVGAGAVARATGAACGANPVGVIVPCHRVVGATGALTGYAGGLQRKAALLRHEGARLA